MASDYEIERLQTKLADVTAERDRLQALIGALDETAKEYIEPPTIWQGDCNGGATGYHIEWVPECTHCHNWEDCDGDCEGCQQYRREHVFGETLADALDQLMQRRKEAATNDSR